MRRTTPRASQFLAVSLCLVFGLGRLSAQTVPARVEVTVDSSQLAERGRATAQLKWFPIREIPNSLQVRLELRAGNRLVLRRDHTPPTKTSDWVVDEPVGYDLTLGFPIVPRAALEAGELDLYIGFLDPRTRRVRSLAGGRREGSGLHYAGSFEFPFDRSEPTEAQVAEAVVAAEELAKTDPAAAWDLCESLLRRSTDYRVKATLRDSLDEIGKFPAPEMDFEEQRIVRSRINGERRRYLREVAGRYWDRGNYFAALDILNDIGGSLAEDADAAVIGALNEAERVSKRKEDLIAKIFEATPEQKAEIKRLRSEHQGDDDGLFEVAKDLAGKASSRAVSRELLLKLGFLSRYREEANNRREDLEKEWLADVPSEQKAMADKARNHPSFARTKTVASHRFLFIGPEKLVGGIPEESKRRFDIAYVYLTDLFGRVPNPGGDRVTVYFKELWDFGGGVGGGKIIDIGRANPEQDDRRVDNGLLYHELTHCIDDTTPIYGGMREGLADFGAAFALHELGQRGPARAAIGNARRAFLQDYVERDLEYWRIPNYGPSAGLLLHFVVTYGKRKGGGYEWERYRQFFREYRNAPVKDARRTGIARSFGRHLVRAFGSQAFDDLIEFRWPLVASDLAAVETEADQAFPGISTVDFEDFEGTPAPRDRVARDLVGEGITPSAAQSSLGVLREWRVIGPFRQKGSDPDAFRFPPELEIDFEKVYTSGDNRPKWYVPGRKPVTIDDTGWVRFHFAYMDNTASYAVTHVTVEEETEAYLHLRGDDDISVFLNDEAVGKGEVVSGPMGPWRPGWRALLPDAMRFAITLQKGRNKVLLKIKNVRGDSGFSAAVADRRGLPIEGWRHEASPPDRIATAPEPVDRKKWGKRLIVTGDKSSAARALEVKAGKFKVRQKAIRGQSTDRGVAWRKYTVRPGFPKDSPSNLGWLPKKATKDLVDFELLVDLVPVDRAPKFLVTFQGEGRDDGLSGWNLILEARGKHCRARLERYDRLVLLSDWVDVTKGKPAKGRDKEANRLSIVYFRERVTIMMDDQMLIDRAPIRGIPGKDRIGFATWGAEPGIRAFSLRAPKRTK